jgi:hypothetical protein
MLGMGSVVTRSIPDFHLALGNPARSVGCVCRCGQLVARFEETPGPARRGCPACGREYRIEAGGATAELEAGSAS